MKTKRTIFRTNTNPAFAAFRIFLCTLFCGVALGGAAQTPRLEITGENFSIAPLQKGGVPFLNRTVKFVTNPPAEYAGCEFTQINAYSAYNPAPLPTLSVEAATSGYIVVMVATGEKPAVCNQWAEDYGWELIPNQRLSYGAGGPLEILSFFRRPIEAHVKQEIVQPATFSGAILVNPLPAITEEIASVPTLIATTGWMETQAFAKGAVAYANRAYTFDMPSASEAVLQNLQITRYNGGGVPSSLVVRAEATGNLYIAISNHEVDFVPQDHGWTQVEGVIFVYNDPDQTRLTLYKKAVNQGELIDIKTTSWQGVHVLSSALTAYSLPVLIAEAKPWVDQLTVNTGVSERLELAYTTANSLLTSEEDAAILNAALDLRAAIDAYAPLREVYVSFEELLAKAKVEALKNYPGATAFNAKIAELSGLFTAATEKTEVEQLTTALYAALTDYVFTQPATSAAPLDVTCLLAHPSFHAGTAHDEAKGTSVGWSTRNVSAGGSDFSVQFKGGKNCWYSWSEDFSSMDLYQRIEGLKPGYYQVSCYAMTKPGCITDQRVYGTSSGTSVYSDALTVDNAFDTPEGWEKLVTGNITVYADGIMQIGFSSTSSGASENGSFCVTDFAVEYKGDYEITETSNALSVSGMLVNGQEERLNNQLTEEITSLDLSGVEISGEVTITAGNPNTLVYGVDANVQVTSGIAEGGTAALDDSKSFYAPRSLSAQLSYTREFNKDNSLCNTTNGNWQTLCLPFDVTRVTAMQGDTEVRLIPISQFQQDESAEAPRPYWLYRIGADNVLVPADAIEANVPYLIAIPNDDATYKPFYNLSGEVVFEGTSIAATTVETGSTSAYNLTNNFAPIAPNATDYGMNAEGTYFVPNVAIRSFNAKVAPVTGSSQPAFIPIFDGEVTALPALPNAAVQEGNVFTVANGVMLQATGQTEIPVYGISGQLVKIVSVEEGMNYLPLPAGQYVIKGTVVLVK